MKLVIEIPDYLIEHAKNLSEDSNDEWTAMRTIANGLPYEQRPCGECRDRLKEVFREASEIGGDLFHISQIERIIDGEDWLSIDRCDTCEKRGLLLICKKCKHYRGSDMKGGKK